MPRVLQPRPQDTGWGGLCDLFLRQYVKMAMDYDMVSVVAVIGGLLLVTVAAGGENMPEKPTVDPLGDVTEMEVENLVEYDRELVVKKADAGDFNARGQAILKYLQDQIWFMMNMRKYFEDGMQGRDVAWLASNDKQNYAALQAAMTWLRAKDTDFKSLWGELSQQGGMREWMMINSWVPNVPMDTFTRLQTYFQVSWDSIQRYGQQLQQQQTDINNELRRQLASFHNEAFRVIQGQANFLQNFAAQQAAFNQRQGAAIDRLENQLGTMEMEVDDEGQWLIKPLGRRSDTVPGATEHGVEGP